MIWGIHICEQSALRPADDLEDRRSGYKAIAVHGARNAVGIPEDGKPAFPSRARRFLHVRGLATHAIGSGGLIGQRQRNP